MAVSDEATTGLASTSCDSVGAWFTTKGDAAGRARPMACVSPSPRSRGSHPMSFRVLAFQLAIFAAAVVGPGSITGWKW